MLRQLVFFLLLSAGPAIAGPGGEAGRYLETDEYLRGVFPAELPAAKVLWVTGELREGVERLLGHWATISNRCVCVIGSTAPRVRGCWTK
jgi:hypothetical protein